MMRARLTSLLLATAWVGAGGCASRPPEEPAAAAVDQACATSSTASQVNDRDTAIDSILTQPTSDPRLAQINRRMYQSLRTLDAELRREQRLAACQPPALDSSTLQVQMNTQQGASAAAAGQSASDAGLDPGAAGAGTAHATANGALESSAVAHTASTRKSSLSNGGGGNGATAPKTVPGNDNDIVARRLRKAAEHETNPALRAKLWKEYTDYRQGTSAK